MRHYFPLGRRQNREADDERPCDRVYLRQIVARMRMRKARNRKIYFKQGDIAVKGRTGRKRQKQKRETESNRKTVIKNQIIKISKRG